MIEEHVSHHPKRLNVWARIIGNHIISPFFIDGNLNGSNYLTLLQNNIVPILTDLYADPPNPQASANMIWFQQAGAPPHYQINFQQYLNRMYPNRWIGKRGSIDGVIRLLFVGICQKYCTQN